MLNNKYVVLGLASFIAMTFQAQALAGPAVTGPHGSWQNKRDIVVLSDNYKNPRIIGVVLPPSPKRDIVVISDSHKNPRIIRVVPPPPEVTIFGQKPIAIPGNVIIDLKPAPFTVK